ncbi:MAG TPA: acyl-CoA reductase, partial [Chitinophagaceae bacterium]|nr:acyl-CoA reductase [Chitinophagaceae bacterium]
MNLQERIDLLVKLGKYLRSNEDAWINAKQKASQENGWFLPAFIQLAADSIADQFLSEPALNSFVSAYQVPATTPAPKTVGLVMAGNIPLVGFHDWLCIFLSGHRALVKTSSKDKVLITHIVDKLASWNEEVTTQTVFSEMLKGCDAYIATGSNNTARYFDYYFSKYPHIIRRNRTSVALLTGNEDAATLALLADDVNLYFGLGCRNVTKIYVPQGYNFVPLLESFNRYAYFADNAKYKNNYDYQLAILLLNHQYYMTNGSVLLVENSAPFSAISQLHYEYYQGQPHEI